MHIILFILSPNLLLLNIFRFSIRSLNRLKYRGYFTIHNPDGRKLTVRRRFLGSNYNKQITNTSSYQKTVWIARKPPIVENIIEVSYFSMIIK